MIYGTYNMPILMNIYKKNCDTFVFMYTCLCVCEIDVENCNWNHNPSYRIMGIAFPRRMYTIVVSVDKIFGGF